MSEEKDALKQLIMLISDLRAKDEERYSSHVDFMNETVRMIRAIENQMNKHWATVLESLKELNENINNNLDSLLTGINPKGLRETSKSLQEIMDTMNKSVQSMNLEKVLSELKELKATAPTTIAPSMPAPTPIPVGQQPEPITAGISLNPPPIGTEPPKEQQEVYGYVPDKKKKKKKEDEDEPHLMKPSDLFKNR